MTTLSERLNDLHRASCRPEPMIAAFVVDLMTASRRLLQLARDPHTRKLVASERADILASWEQLNDVLDWTALELGDPS